MSAVVVKATREYIVRLMSTTSCTIYVSSYYWMCTSAIYVSSYYYYVSSYYYICVLILLNVSVTNSDLLVECISHIVGKLVVNLI